MPAPKIYTASDIITDALQKLAVYSPGDLITDADMQRGLITLNDMLDQWQNEYVFIYSLTTITLNLAKGAASYTVGPVGSLTNSPNGRPDRVQTGPGAASVVMGGTTYQVNVISEIQWNAIQSISPIPGVPDNMFYDPQYPVAIVNVAPTPNAVGVLTFYGLSPFTLFSTSATAGAFSQGTADAVKDNLAVCLKPYFMTQQLDPIIEQRAMMTKEFLRTTGTLSRAMLKRSPNPVGKPSAGAA